MINECTTHVDGAPSLGQAARCTRSAKRAQARVAPILLAAILAAVFTVASSAVALAQDGGMRTRDDDPRAQVEVQPAVRIDQEAQADAQADVLTYVESQFGGYGLRQVSAVVISSDDKHVYAAGEEDDAVVHFTRDETTGDLTYVATYVNGENNVMGLNDPVDLVLSPDSDSQNLYAVAKGDDAIVVFSRDATSGALTFVETKMNGMDGVEQLYDPDAASISADGANVYVAGDTALTVFSRSAADGTLQFVESEQPSEAGASFELRDVIVSPDDANVYVTSHLANAVAVLQRDTGDMGKVSVTQVITAGDGGVTGLYLTQKLAISMDGSSVYATGAISPTGVLSGTVVAFERGGDGSLAYAATYVSGESGVDGIAGARSVLASADGKNVYVAGATGNSVAVFDRDAGGSLTYASCVAANTLYNSCKKKVAGLKNPSDLALTDDGATLYVTGKESDAINIFARSAADGALTLRDEVYNSDGGVPGLGGADDVAVSSDGQHVYAAGGRDNSVVVFERSPGEMGKLQFVEAQKEGVGGVSGLLEASSVSVSPDGNNVYATGAADGTVVVFARDMMSGTLTFVEKFQQGEDGVGGIGGAWRGVVSQDGKNVYVTGLDEDGIGVFGRNATTGQLTFVQTILDGVDSVTDMQGPMGIVLSPNGEQVYVAASSDDGVVAFTRDDADGKLTFLESYANQPGLNGPISVDISSDGQNVYVASAVSGTVTPFRRDALTGKLSRQGASASAAQGDSSAEVTAEQSQLELYWGVKVSPDDKYVYAVAWDVTESLDSSIGKVIVFAREPGSGLLSKAQTLQNDEGDIRGLRTPTSLAVTSMDGDSVYVTSFRDSAVLVFDVTGSAEYEDTHFLPYMAQ